MSEGSVFLNLYMGLVFYKTIDYFDPGFDLGLGPGLDLGSGLGPGLDRLGSGLDRLGSGLDRLGLDRLGSGLDRPDPGLLAHLTKPRQPRQRPRQLSSSYADACTSTRTRKQ